MPIVNVWNLSFRVCMYVFVYARSLCVCLPQGGWCGRGLAVAAKDGLVEEDRFVVLSRESVRTVFKTLLDFLLVARSWRQVLFVVLYLPTIEQKAATQRNTEVLVMKIENDQAW